MAHVIIRHRVANFETWNRAFQQGAGARKSAGFTGHLLVRDSADANLLTCILSASDLARAKAFVASPELHHAMEAAGVQGKPEVSFCEDVEAPTY